MIYSLLPFRFVRFDSNQELITNEAGEFLFVPQHTVSRIVNQKIVPGTDEYKTLLAKHIIVDDKSVPCLDILCSKLKTKKNHLGNGISLHLVVITRRCNQSCRYCQISKRDCGESQYDMNHDTIDRVIDAAFASSSDPFTLEIQGGEPLLAMDKIRYLVEQARKKSDHTRKQMNVVLCTNLTLADDELFKYCKDNDISISTSLDGPQILHNRYRVLPEGNSHEIVTKNIRKAISELGTGKVSALMTTTQYSFKHINEIVDEYISLGLNHIFLRKLNEYGFARRDEVEKYSAEDFLSFYKQGLSYIMHKNREGNNIVEVFAAILLKKILTPYNTGYVDLLSPPGLGISFAAYDYNGNVYASDEARMLGAMGDDTFLLGNLYQDSYENMFYNTNLKAIHEQSMAECVPGCVDCVFLPYCGSDPIYHYNTQRDFVGNKSCSGFCKINYGILRHLFEQIAQNDIEDQKIFWSWIRNIPVSEIEKGLPGHD